eukprot:g2154.t1
MSNHLQKNPTAADLCAKQRKTNWTTEDGSLGSYKNPSQFFSETTSQFQKPSNVKRTVSANVNPYVSSVELSLDKNASLDKSVTTSDFCSETSVFSKSYKKRSLPEGFDRLSANKTHYDYAHPNAPLNPYRSAQQLHFEAPEKSMTHPNKHGLATKFKERTDQGNNYDVINFREQNEGAIISFIPRAAPYEIKKSDHDQWNNIKTGVRNYDLITGKPLRK